MRHRHVAVLILIASVGGDAFAAEDFCADFWSGLTSAQKVDFMRAADAWAAEKAPAANRPELRACLEARRPSLQSSLDRACGTDADAAEIAAILESSLTPCVESIERGE